MVGVLAKIKIKLGTNSEFEEAIKKMSMAVRDNEKGNLYYDVFNGEDDTTYIVMEKYNDQSDLDAHSKSDHFRSIGKEMGQFMDGAPEVKVLISI